jgi:hypothetical protein
LLELKQFSDVTGILETGVYVMFILFQHHGRPALLPALE